MSLFRRRHVLGILSSSVAAGFGGCQSLGVQRSFQKGGQIQTEEPVVRNVNIQSNSHEYYSFLVSDNDDASRVRWEYLTSEDDVFSEMFREANYDKHFIAISGIRLDSTYKISSTDTEFNKGRMVQKHQIVRSRSEIEESFHTVFELWEKGTVTVPRSVSTEYTISEETV